MTKKSAGILIFRKNAKGAEVLLVHPGGPFWQRKDKGAWSIPKGEFTDEEDPFTAAKRETLEETGIELKGDFIPLRAVKQKNGKVVHGWANEGNYSLQNFVSNLFKIEWPHSSGQYKEFPEVDRVEWFTIEEAKKRIIPGQLPFLDELNDFIFNNGKG